MSYFKKLKVAITVIAIATISSIEPTAPTFSQAVELRGLIRILQATTKQRGQNSHCKQGLNKCQTSLRDTSSFI
jgi:hypothetical protein